MVFCQALHHKHVSVPKPSCHCSRSPTIPLGILWITQLPNAKNWILSSSAVCLQPLPRICISLISHDCSIATNSKRSGLLFHFSAVEWKIQDCSSVSVSQPSQNCRRNIRI